MGTSKKELYADLLDVGGDGLRPARGMADIVLFAQVLPDRALASAHKGLAKLAGRLSAPKFPVSPERGW